MSLPLSMTHLAGSWRGRNQVWLQPGVAPMVCPTTAEVKTVANGKFLSIDYHWTDGDGIPQHGLILLGQEGQGGKVHTVFVDSWHMGDGIMVCEGEGRPGDEMSAQGSYPAPEGPDWGWRIAVTPQKEDEFAVRMYNITPDGEVYLGVESIYTRSK